MRKIFRLALLVCAAFFCAPEGAMAIPSRPGKFLWKKADGSKIWLRLRGDEFEHYYETEDGQKLVEGENGELVPMTNGPKRAPLKRVTIDGMITNYPTIGSPNALVLLLEYEDVKFTTANANYEFNRLVNERGYDYNGATGSVSDYFRDNSRGLFTPNFVVCGPVTLPHTMAYYGAPTAMAHDSCPWEMVADGCVLLKEQHPELDFSQFDNDGDGVVDNVFVFYAGYGQNSGASVNTVWPHSANLSWYGLNVVIDGVKVDNYACSNEITGTELGDGARCGIGTFCHEFSHVLGLPDLYSTDYSSAFTPGAYELMDTGPYNNNGNTPPFMSAFDRMRLRWLNPRELTAPENITLRPMGVENADACIIKTISETEYFLLENRQQESWDKFIPGHGMLVWHIDWDDDVFSNNALNNNPSHQRVDIIEADGLRTAESRAGDPFPGRTGVTELTDYSSPSMATWTGTLVGKPLTAITEIDGIITFKVMGGGAGVPVVEAVAAEQVTPVSFRAVWKGNTSISEYEIDVCEGDEVVPYVTFKKTISSLADCYFDVVDLLPNHKYSYCVRAVDGEARSANSNVVAVNTLPPTFDMLTPVAMEAAEVTSGSFRAQWQPLEGADGYLLDVYTKEYVEPVYDVVDFTGGLSELPEGWQTSSSATSGAVGTFGEARPSLIFKTDKDFIVSRTYDVDLNSLSFWYKGNSGAEGTLCVELFIDGKWEQLDEVAVSATAKTWREDLPMGVSRVRLIVSLSAGSVYVDDIRVAYNGAAQFVYVDGYERRELAGGTLSHTVTGLRPLTNYFYTITGKQGSMISLVSKEVELRTLNADAVEGVKGGTAVSRTRVFIRGGQVVVETPAGENYDVTGRRLREK